MWQATSSVPFLCSSDTPSQVKTGIRLKNASGAMSLPIPNVHATHAGLHRRL